MGAVGVGRGTNPVAYNIRRSPKNKIKRGFFAVEILIVMAKNKYILKKQVNENLEKISKCIRKNKLALALEKYRSDNPKLKKKQRRH